MCELDLDPGPGIFPRGSSSPHSYMEYPNVKCERSSHLVLTLGGTCSLSSSALWATPHMNLVSVPTYLSNRDEHLFKDGIGWGLVRTAVLDANMECTGFGNKPVMEKTQKPILNMVCQA